MDTELVESNVGQDDSPPVAQDELENVSVEGDEASAESDESEAESEEKVEEPEESYEEKVDRLAMSKSDKFLQKYHKEKADLMNRNAELETQLTERTWSRHLKSLFTDEAEELGEDEAKVKLSDRQKVADDIKHFQINEHKVNAILAKVGDVDLDDILKQLNSRTLAEGVPKLAWQVRDNMAWEFLRKLHFPDEKAKVELIGRELKKFEKAKDMGDFEAICEGMLEVAKAKKKPFVPDSSQSGAGRGVGFSSSPEDKVTKGIEAIKRKQR